jgi:hypothetical protein
MIYAQIQCPANARRNKRCRGYDANATVFRVSSLLPYPSCYAVTKGRAAAAPPIPYAPVVTEPRSRDFSFLVTSPLDYHALTSLSNSRSAVPHEPASVTLPVSSYPRPSEVPLCELWRFVRDLPSNLILPTGFMLASTSPGFPRNIFQPPPLGIQLKEASSASRGVFLAGHVLDPRPPTARPPSVSPGALCDRPRCHTYS